MLGFIQLLACQRRLTASLVELLADSSQLFLCPCRFLAHYGENPLCTCQFLLPLIEPCDRCRPGLFRLDESGPNPGEFRARFLQPLSCAFCVLAGAREKLLCVRQGIANISGPPAVITGSVVPINLT